MQFKLAQATTSSRILKDQRKEKTALIEKKKNNIKKIIIEYVTLNMIMLAKIVRMVNITK